MNKRIYPKVSLHNNLIALGLLLLLGCFAETSAQWTTPDGNQNTSHINTRHIGIATTGLFESKKNLNAGPLRLTAAGTRGIGTTSPRPKVVMFDNFLAGNISSFTLLYPGYDSQSNVIMELGYGTATSNVAPLASLVLSKNLTSNNNAIGVISFANSSIANGNEKRVASIGGATDGAPNSGVLSFGTTNAGLIAEQMRITSTGKVGIGNTNPSEKLEITGNLKVSGTGNITAVGTIEGGNIKAKYQDMAEWVESSQELPGGAVVVLDSGKSNHVIASSSAYDSRVAGVISLQPGITLGEHAEGRVLVATTGRVKVKVDASNGPINIGDLLVTSDKPGVAMKSVPVEIGGVRIHRPGTLIGKALEPLAAGTGEILVLLSLQ